MDCLDIEDGDVATLAIKHGWKLQHLRMIFPALPS